MNTTDQSTPSMANKYDRQLRLWGAQGQRALSESSVVLIRATAVGTETLKNLVLPGVGRFHILDDVYDDNSNHHHHNKGSNNQKRGASSNFFLSNGKSTTYTSSENSFPSATTTSGNTDAATRSNPITATASASRPNGGWSRAEMACRYLQELNPDCQGTFQHVSSSLLSDNPHWDWNEVFQGLQTANHHRLLVIASDVEPPLMERLSQICHQRNHPILFVHSYGYIGIVRIQTPPMAILDPKSTHTSPDLRLVHPLPEFIQLYESILSLPTTTGPSSSSSSSSSSSPPPVTSSSTSSSSSSWDALPDHQHGHIPYPFILYAVSQEWKSNHDGALPSTRDEKDEFRTWIQRKSRDYGKELNFQEAVQNAYLAYTEPILEESSYEEESWTNRLDPTSPLGYLWQALNQFRAKHSRLPIHGTIPDMTSSTELYVRLQTIYRNQAQRDMDDITSFLPPNVVSDDDVQKFCANVVRIRQFTTRTVAEEYQSTTTTTNDDSLLEDWIMATMDPYEIPEHTPFLWYLAFRACQEFYIRHGRYPGTLFPNEMNMNDDWENDIPLLVQECFPTILQRYQLSSNEFCQQYFLSPSTYGQKIASEMTRYANAEIHTIASIIGGVASQEAVKLITGQYVPLDNCYVYNGIASVGGVYRF